MFININTVYMFINILRFFHSEGERMGKAGMGKRTGKAEDEMKPGCGKRHEKVQVEKGICEGLGEAEKAAVKSQPLGKQGKRP